MFSRSLWLLVFASISTGPAAAGPVVPVEVAVELDSAAGTGVPAFAGALRVGSLDPAAAPEATRRPFDGPGTTVLALPRNTSWTVALEAPGYWAPPAVVLAREEPAPQRVLLRAERTGVIAGRLAVDAGEDLPAEIDLRFAPSPGRKADPDTPVSGMTAGSSCPVGSEGRFRCELPARTLDFRLRARRFVSHFFWGTDVPAVGFVDLGEIRLARGSSVAGTVETADESPLPEDLEVRLMPATGGRVRDSAVEQRLRARALTAETTADGFFFFEATPPGGYSVEALAAGWVTARWPIDVYEDSEAELTRALVLERPARVELTLSPPVDPFGTPWTVTLVELSELAGDLREVSAEADEAGGWPAQALPPGRYDVSVSTARGPRHTAWLSREITVESGSNRLHLEVPVVPIEGTVEMGGVPLAATLWFGGTFGAQKAGFDADEDGRFVGYLPREGEWPVELVEAANGSRIRLGPVEVERRPGRPVAEVEISIPDTRLLGEVVDARGEPVPRAYVSVTNLRWDLDHLARNSRVWTERDGSFSIWGFEPGSLTVSARTREASSAWVPVDVVEGREPAPVRLVLQRRLRLTGRVVSPHGVVPGAQIQALVSTPGSPTREVTQAMSSGDGRFSLGIPHGSDSLSIAVRAPGYAVQVQRAAVDPERSLDLALVEAGGRLVLDLPAPDDALAEPFLEFRGARFPLKWLSRWREPTESAERWVLPRMEAGDYSICRADRCARGFLAPYGELGLRLPGGGSEG